MDPKLREQIDDLNKTLDDELARRERTAKSPDEVYRGFEDFCREQTARFLFNNPTFTAEWWYSGDIIPDL